MGAPVRILLLLLCALVLGCAHHAMAPALSPGDRIALAAVIDQQSARQREAWFARDAAQIIPDTTIDAPIRTPDGNAPTAGAVRRDLQKRMDMTARIDTMNAQIDSVHTVGRDSVVVYSSQRFVRVIRIEEGVERQRFSTVTHEQLYVRHDGRWVATGPFREIDPRAWWAGEQPPVR